MIDYPSTFSENILSLPTAGLSQDDQAALQQLADQGYGLYYGLTKQYAEAIIAMALEADIREYCPRDSAERFASLEATQQWLGKKRGMFLLLANSAGGQLELAGYGWAGAETSAEVTGGQTTFAVRIGQKHQGNGLATPFCRLIVDGAATMYGGRDFWLETWGSNGGAVHIYHKLGFETVAEKAAERPTADGSRVDDVRVTMKLANELLPNET